MRVASIREVGPLSEVGPCFGRLFKWAAAIEAPPPGIELDEVDGGRHAVHRLVGPHERIGQAYRRLFDEWLPGSGESVAQRPCMELYRNMPSETAPENLVTDVCVPLQKPRKGRATDA